MRTYKLYQLVQSYDELGLSKSDYEYICDIECQLSYSTITDVNNGLVYQVQQITGLVGGSADIFEKGGKYRLDDNFIVNSSIGRVLYLSEVV